MNKKAKTNGGRHKDIKKVQKANRQKEKKERKQILPKIKTDRKTVTKLKKDRQKRYKKKQAEEDKIKSFYVCFFLKKNGKTNRKIN